jgi:UDP-galactopyranose mutase
VRLTLEAGLPLLGLCIYPAIDTPDWNDFTRWHQGLWSRPDSAGQRQVDHQLAQELQQLGFNKPSQQKAVG